MSGLALQTSVGRLFAPRPLCYDVCLIRSYKEQGIEAPHTDAGDRKFGRSASSRCGQLRCRILTTLFVIAIHVKDHYPFPEVTAVSTPFEQMAVGVKASWPKKGSGRKLWSLSPKTKKLLAWLV